MDDELDQALQVEVMMASLQLDQGETKNSLEYLANMLEKALPANTAVRRGGWFLSGSKPVEELTVRFDDFHYQIVSQKNGSFIASQMKIVRGVVLKTTEISMEQCIDEIVKQLTELSEKNSRARAALNRFVTGG